MVARAFQQFFNSSAQLSSANLIATVCSALTTIVVPKYVGLTLLSDFAISTSIYSLGSFCLNLGIPLLLVRVETDEEARELFSIGVKILIRSLFLLLPAAVLISCLVFSRSVRLMDVLLSLSVSAAAQLGALGQLLQFWALRKGNSTAVARAIISAALLQSFLAVVLVVWTGEVVGMMIGVVVGMLVSCLLLLRIAPSRSRDSRSFRALVSVHSKYFQYAVPQTLFDECGRFAYFAMLRTVFAEPILGAFFFADRVLRLPTSIAGSSCAQALLASSRSDAYSRNPKSFVDSVIVFLLAASLIMFLPMALWGRELFSWIFGRQVAQAGVLAQIFAGYFLMRTISSALSPIVTIDGRFKGMFQLGLGYHVIMCGGVAVAGAFFRDPIEGLFFHAAVSALFLCYVVIWLRRGVH